jgi:hypothetical protein
MDNEHNTNLLDYGSLLDSQFDNEIDPQIEDEPNYLVDESPKKKGRPQSEHYVKESELRYEIELAQNNKFNFLEKLANEWDEKILKLSTLPEKNSMHLEKEKSIAAATLKTYCTRRLGEIVVLTVDRVATQTKFRHYTYLDDMKAEAIYQSIKGITKFDITKTNELGQKSSSFSYLTQIITNAFRQILKKEKKNREIKDQAIEIALDNRTDIDTDFESIRRKREKMDGYIC